MLLAKLHELHVPKNVSARWSGVPSECAVLFAKLFEWRLQSGRQLHANRPTMLQQRAVLLAKMRELRLPAVMLIP